MNLMYSTLHLNLLHFPLFTNKSSQGNYSKRWVWDRYTYKIKFKQDYINYNICDDKKVTLLSTRNNVQQNNQFPKMQERTISWRTFICAYTGKTCIRTQTLRTFTLRTNTWASSQPQRSCRANSRTWPSILLRISVAYSLVVLTRRTSLTATSSSPLFSFPSLWRGELGRIRLM